MSGTMRGHPGPRRSALPALPPIRLPPRPRVSSRGMTCDQVVDAMVDAFKSACRGRGASGLIARLEDGTWRATAQAMAMELIDTGRSPDAFVRYVCETVRVRKGRWPWASEVFSMRALYGWLPEYGKHGTKTLKIPTYAASKERLKLHDERILNARRNVRVHSGD